MDFIYVFLLMFFSIFGLAALIKLFAGALFRSSRRRFDVYVRTDEGVEEFVDYARKSPNIGEINLILSGGETDEEAALLAEKYADVHTVGSKVGEDAVGNSK